MTVRLGSWTLALGCAGLLLLGGSASALDPHKAATQYAIRSWGIDEGLPQSSARVLAQTPDGYLWIGTEEGLARFDGVRFQVFDPRNTPELRGSVVLGLWTDARGALWIALREGLARFRDGRFAWYGGRPDGAPSLSHVGGQDRQGRLWTGGEDGLSLFEDGRFIPYNAATGIPKGRVTAIHGSRDRGLWVATIDGRLYKWRDGRPATDMDGNAVPADHAHALYEDADGGLWMGTHHGLRRWQDGRSLPVDLGIPVGGVQAFLPDREGNLWIAAERGLVRYRDGRAELLDARWGLAHDFVMSLLEDREGNLWVGTRAGGVTRISDAPFTAFTKREGLSDDMAGVIQEDGEGDIWAATDTGGVNRLRGRSVRVYTTRDGLLSDMVSAVWPARQGGVWIGTDRGVNHILGERVSTLLEMDRAVTALLEDRGGDLWIGTNAGLHRWSHERLTTYTTREGLSSDHVADLREGRDGALWIATLDGGVTRLHGGQFTRYTVADGLPAHGTTAIYEDQDGVVWIGTLGGGLARLKDGRIAGFRQEHALPDKVGSILEDDRGYLWMGSNTGVVRVAKADLHAAADGRGGRIAFTTYGRAEGMPTRECKVGGWRSRDGRLWFATIKGVTVIDPNRLPPQAPPPPAIIEEMRVNGKPVALADGRELDPGSNALELVYTALRLSDPETLRFRYRLEGLDTEWQEVGPRRTAYYTNLPPGRYRFRVSAGNPEGAWNEADAELSFRIRPRFYQTTWFALFLATAVLGAAFALHRFQVALLQARNAVLEERNRIAREVHDGVAQGIGGIAIQLEAARGAADADRAAQHVERARGLADQTLTELRRSLSALRPALLDGLSLPEAMDRLLEPFAAGAGVEARLEVVGQEIELAAEPATHVLRITQEALYNAVRHGHPRRIEIQLSYEPHHLRLRVADDGHGFARDSPGPGGEQGHGLRTMRERAERLGGRLSVTSAPDRGTEVVLLLPTRGRALATLWSALVRLGAGRPAA